MLAWEGALRWLWNLAHEQRLIGLSRQRAERRYYTSFDQINQLAAVRSEAQWLADVPRNACAQLLVELDKAWQRCFKRLSRAPHWKCRGRDFLSLCEPHPKAFRLDGAVIRFPKLGNLRAIVHRPLEGKAKTCRLMRDGDQWFAIIACEVQITDPAPRHEPVVALDRGITNLLADSDGSLTPNPRFYERAMKRLARADRTVSRRKKGSKNREKAQIRVMRLHRKVRRQREHVLHQLSHDYAKSHGTVVIERLNVQSMVKNHCLARRILDAGWGMFGEMLRYKLESSGGQMVAVPPEYSSRTCSACGVVDAASRKGERFCCTACGHEDHADINAAKVLKRRFETPGSPWCLPVEGSVLEAARRSRKPKVILRVPRKKLSECSGL